MNVITSKKGQTVKKNDPYTRIQRQGLSSLSVTLPIFTGLVILVMLNPHNDLPYKIFFLVLYAVLLLMSGFALLRFRSNLKRLEERRQRVLQGDSSLLAREQPSPDVQILPLPTTIKLD